MDSLPTLQLVSLLLPPRTEWMLIGSRAYGAQSLSSDYDFMVPLEDRAGVLLHLGKLGINPVSGSCGSMKFVVVVSPGVPRVGVEINFCFIHKNDWSAWISATNVMKNLARNMPTSFSELDKKTRLNIFSDLVVDFGGLRPPVSLKS